IRGNRYIVGQQCRVDLGGGRDLGLLVHMLDQQEAGDERNDGQHGGELEPALRTRSAEGQRGAAATADRLDGGGVLGLANQTCPLERLFARETQPFGDIGRQLARTFV